VGIFVNAPPADVAALCKSLKLDAAQLHGDETAETLPSWPAASLSSKPFAWIRIFDLKTLWTIIPALCLSV